MEISSVSGVVTPMKQNGPRLLDITGGSTFEARSALCWWVHKGHRWTDGVTNSALLLCTTETHISEQMGACVNLTVEVTKLPGCIALTVDSIHACELCPRCYVCKAD